MFHPHIWKTYLPYLRSIAIFKRKPVRTMTMKGILSCKEQYSHLSLVAIRLICAKQFIILLSVSTIIRYSIAFPVFVCLCKMAVLLPMISLKSLVYFTILSSLHTSPSILHELLHPIFVAGSLTREKLMKFQKI